MKQSSITAARSKQTSSSCSSSALILCDQSLKYISPETDQSLVTVRLCFSFGAIMFTSTFYFVFMFAFLFFLLFLFITISIIIIVIISIFRWPQQATKVGQVLFDDPAKWHNSLSASRLLPPSQFLLIAYSFPLLVWRSISSSSGSTSYSSCREKVDCSRYKIDLQSYFSNLVTNHEERKSERVENNKQRL